MGSIVKQMLFVVLAVISLFPPLWGKQYKIATVAWIGWSPLHVASERGFWRDQGVDLSVIHYDDPTVILEAIKAGKIDFAMDMAGSLVGIFMKGEPVRAIVETNWSHGGDKIIVKVGDRLESHKKAPLGVFLLQPSCLFFLDRYLNTIDLTISDFRIIEINSRDLTAQFIAGRLPAIVNYEPWATYALKRGNGEVLATSADFAGCIPEVMWGYQSVLEKIPVKDIYGIIKGWITAVQWINDPVNRAAYYQILKERTFEGDITLTQKDFSSMLNNVRIHDPGMLYERNRDDGGLEKYLTNLHFFLEQHHIMTRDFTPRDIFDNRYILEVLDKNQVECGSYR